MKYLDEVCWWSMLMKSADVIFCIITFKTTSNLKILFESKTFTTNALTQNIYNQCKFESIVLFRLNTQKANKNPKI